MSCIHSTTGGRTLTAASLCIGPGIGKLVKIGPLPVKFAAEMDYLAIHPDDFGQHLGVRFQIIPVLRALFKDTLFYRLMIRKTATEKGTIPMRNFVIYVSAVLVLASSTLPHSAWAQTQPAGSAPTGYVLVEEDVVITFASEAKKSFRAAVADFLNRQMRAAGTNVRKGAAYIRLEAGRAAGDAKKALMDSVQELEKLANEVQKAAVSDLKELQNAFARAEHALARHHYLKAVELRAKGDGQKTGRELQAAADYIDSGQVWLTQKMHEGVGDSVNEARRVAAKMVYGSGAAVDEVGKAFDGLGKELDKFGSAVAGVKK